MQCEDWPRIQSSRLRKTTHSDTFGSLRWPFRKSGEVSSALNRAVTHPTNSIRLIQYIMGRCCSGRKLRRKMFTQNPIQTIRLNQLGLYLRSQLPHIKLRLVAQRFMRSWVARARARIRRKHLRLALEEIAASMQSYEVRAQLDEHFDASVSEPLKQFIFWLELQPLQIFDAQKQEKTGTQEQDNN